MFAILYSFHNHPRKAIPQHAICSIRVHSLRVYYGNEADGGGSFIDRRRDVWNGGRTVDSSCWRGSAAGVATDLSSFNDVCCLYARQFTLRFQASSVFAPSQQLHIPRLEDAQLGASA